MSQTKSGNGAQGATMPTTVEQVDKALERDFQVLHTMLLMIRTSPTLRRAMAEELISIEERAKQQREAVQA